jgi:predicted nucleic acid-binding protein
MSLLDGGAIFAKEKPRNVEHEICRRLTKHKKEQSMEYLILLAVVSVMALYALIIVGCLKQPEW